MGSCYPSPCVWAPYHIGGSSAADSAGTNPPLSPQTEFPPILDNDPHLPAPLCIIPHSDGAGSAAASTLFPVPSPIVPSGVVRSVCRDLIVLSLLSSLLSRSNYQHFIPRTTNCPPPIKNQLCQLLRMPHLNKLTNPIFHEMHPGVRIEVQKGALLHRVLTTTS